MKKLIIILLLLTACKKTTTHPKPSQQPCAFGLITPKVAGFWISKDTTNGFDLYFMEFENLTPAPHLFYLKFKDSSSITEQATSVGIIASDFGPVDVMEFENKMLARGGLVYYEIDGNRRKLTDSETALTLEYMNCLESL